MDPIKNPFSPGAGAPPPELVGRDNILKKAEILLGRTREKRCEKSLLLVGLRGVGKTVLLHEIQQRTKEAGYQTIMIEAHEGKSLADMVTPYLRSMLFSLDRSEKVSRGLRVLKSFVSSIKVKISEIEFGIDIEPERGAADSGDLEADLSNLFIAVAEAAQDRNTVIAMLIDEIQYLSEKELSALIMAMHKMQQCRLPLILLGAGLPILTRLAGESKSYAERLFEFPKIGPLSNDDAAKALLDPVVRAHVTFDDDAINEIVRITQGYPYFIQEWGYQAWNHAHNMCITLDDVKNATTTVTERLDENFFRVRFDRLTPSEKNFLRAMACVPCVGGVYRFSDVAAALGVKVTSLSLKRSQLIHKGMIYGPSHGDISFSVPLFDAFMCRAIPQFQSQEERGKG